MRAAATFSFPEGPSISTLVRSFVHKHRLRACCEPSAVLSLWYLAPALREAVALPDRLTHTGFDCMRAPLMQR